MVSAPQVLSTFTQSEVPTTQRVQEDRPPEHEGKKYILREVDFCHA